MPVQSTVEAWAAHFAALRKSREQFARGIAKLEASKLSPRNSGTVTREARFMSAAPRANKGAYKTTGYATLPGMRYDKGSSRNVAREPCPESCLCHCTDPKTRR